MVGTDDGCTLSQTCIPYISLVESSSSRCSCASAIVAHGIKCLVHLSIGGEDIELREGEESGTATSGIHREAIVLISSFASNRLRIVVQYVLVGGEATSDNRHRSPSLLVVRTLNSNLCGTVCVVLLTFLEIEAEALCLLAQVGLQVVSYAIGARIMTVVSTMEVCIVVAVNQGRISLSISGIRGIITLILICILHQTEIALQAIDVHISISCYSSLDRSKYFSILHKLDIADVEVLVVASSKLEG